MKWIIKYKTLVLGVVLFVVAFAIGWNTKPILFQPSRMKELTDSLALLRQDVQGLHDQEAINALARRNLEKILRDTLVSVAKSHEHDSVLIRQYDKLLTRKYTPHEIEIKMLDIYTEFHSRK